MKMLTKWFALLLALALILSLAACGDSKDNAKDSTPAPIPTGEASNETAAPAAQNTETPAVPEEPASVIGTWYGELKLNKLYAREFELDSDEDEDIDSKWIRLVYSTVGDMPAGFYAAVGEDGRYSVRFDKDSIDAITEAAQKLWPEMEALRLEMTVEELEKRLAEEGMTMEELIEEDRRDLEEFTMVFSELADVGNILDNLPYEIDGDKLILTLAEEEPEEDPGFKAVITFTCTADTLKLIDTDSDEADAIFAGITMTRVG